MALRLTLIAHARTLASKQARFPLDEPVEIDREPRNREWSKMFGRRARFVCGPELRTRQTAALFSDDVGISDSLSDCDFGCWGGRRVEEIEPAEMGAWIHNSEAAPHGGESIHEVCQRVGDWMDSLSGNGHIVAVTHPFLMRAALLKVLHCPPASFHTIDIEPLSAVDFRFNGVWRMRAVGLDALP